MEGGDISKGVPYRGASRNFLRENLGGVLAFFLENP